MLLGLVNFAPLQMAVKNSNRNKETEAIGIEPDNIEVFGARVHNLKNVDVTIPRNQFVVITGISGSGKSSLAFDTIYNEGQRRYLDSFSAYARKFIGGYERPDVDKITGLSPVISIEQKSVNRNPRSTVGTVTEIYDFMRLLFARASDAYSYVTGKKMVKFTEEQIIDNLLQHHSGKKIIVLAPVVRGRKGHYRELFEQVRKQGYLKIRIDGEIVDVKPKMQVDRYVVQPGVTVPFHTNAKGRPYILVACSSLKFVSLGEDAKLREYRQMEPGEILNREAGFGHQFINVSDQDFVVLKI